MKHFNLVDFICNNNLNKRWSTVHESHTELFLCVTWWTDQKIDCPWSKPETKYIPNISNMNTMEKSLRLLVTVVNGENDPRIDVKLL